MAGPPKPPPPILVGVFVGVPGVGTPAIHHHGKGIPTPDEVRKFVRTYGFPGGKTVSGQPTIQSVDFMAASAANIKLQNYLRGGRVHIFDMATVIVVELAGPFIVTKGPAWAKSPLYVNNAVEVFDAATGNLLFYWPV